ASKLIGQAKAKKDEATAQSLMAEVAGLKEAIANGEEKSKAIDAEIEKVLAEIPNLPAEDVPDGADENDNKEVEPRGVSLIRNLRGDEAASELKARYPQRPTLGFAPKEHFDLGEGLGLMDFEAAARISGARFVVLKNDLARLERALGSFMLDLHTR